MQSKKQPFVRWTRELGGKQTNKQTPKKEYLEWNKIMLAVLYNNFLRRNHLIAVNTVFIIAGTYSYSFVAFIKSQIEPPPHTQRLFFYTHTETHTYTLGSHFDSKVRKTISLHSQGTLLSSSPQSQWTCPQYTHHGRKQKFLTQNFILTYLLKQCAGLNAFYMASNSKNLVKQNCTDHHYSNFHKWCSL